MIKCVLRCPVLVKLIDGQWACFMGYWIWLLSIHMFYIAVTFKRRTRNLQVVQNIWRTKRLDALSLPRHERNKIENIIDQSAEERPDIVIFVSVKKDCQSWLAWSAKKLFMASIRLMSRMFVRFNFWSHVLFSDWIYCDLIISKWKQLIFVYFYPQTVDICCYFRHTLR